GEIGLGFGDLDFPNVSIHRHQVAGKARKLVVGNLLAVHLAPYLLKILQDRNSQRRARADGPVQGGFERLNVLETEHRHKIAGIPEASAIGDTMALKEVPFLIEIRGNFRHENSVWAMLAGPK